MPRERTEETAYLIPRPIPEVVATFIMDADHELCLYLRAMLRLPRFGRGDEFNMVLTIMQRDPHLTYSVFV